jgi:ABC-type glutathione transport system ATPase component
LAFPSSGLVAARVSIFRAIIDPIMTTAGTAPILVAAPFLLIWFGVRRASAVGLVIFYVAVIMYLFAQKVANNLSPIYEEFARTLGAGPRRELERGIAIGWEPDTNATTQRIIELVHVHRDFRRADGQRVKAVNDVPLVIPEGQFVCLVGSSGCGKSTLLQMLAGGLSGQRP